MTAEIANLIHDWNPKALAPDRRVEVLDDTLRDGLQSPSSHNPSVDEKKRFLHLAHELGIESVVLGLPGAGADAQNAVVELAKYISQASLNLKMVSAVRTHQNDIHAHLDACQRSGEVITAGMFLGSSPIRFFAEGWKISELVALTAKSVAACVQRGSPVMFITEDTTRARPQDLRDLYMAALDAGATRLCLADTCGHADPGGAAILIGFVRNLIRESGCDAVIDWHGHNDRGLALSNALAAVEAGANRIHATGLGLGERTGNTAMDQLLINLQLKGQAPPRALARLAEYCRFAHEICAAPLPYNYPVLGRDAFRTSTGVHAAAIVKLVERQEYDLADRVYSAVPAALFGMEQIIEVGPMSGRSNVQHWLSRHHPDLPFELREQCVESILVTAKTSPTVMADATLSAIVNRQLTAAASAAVSA